MAELIPFNDSDAKDQAQGEEPRAFSNEEVSEIIRTALKTAGRRDSDTINYEEMLAVARDFGLSAADITRALETIDQSRGHAEVQSRAWLSFKIHALVFGILMVSLAGINALSVVGFVGNNWLSDPSFWWVLYPLVGWGALVGLHGALARNFPEQVTMLLRLGSRKLQEMTDSSHGESGSEPAARFSVPDLYHGMAQASGLVQMHDDELLIEFETKDSIFGALQSGVREIRVPVSDLSAVRLDRDFWNTKLVLRGKRLMCFEGFPGHDGGQIRLTLDKHSRAAGERLARELSSRIAPA